MCSFLNFLSSINDRLRRADAAQHQRRTNLVAPVFRHKCLDYVDCHVVTSHAATPCRVIARIAGHLCDCHAYLKYPLSLFMFHLHMDADQISQRIVHWIERVRAGDQHLGSEGRGRRGRPVGAVRRAWRLP